MTRIPLDEPFSPASSEVRASVVLDEGKAKVRRIDLAAGARIPPCPMQDDVVFVVLSGRVTFRSDGAAETVEAPGAVFIPGHGVTRSMVADIPSLVLAVLCRATTGTEVVP